MPARRDAANVVAHVAVAATPARPTRPPYTRRTDVDYVAQLGAAGLGLGLAYGVAKAKAVLDTPSRTYVPGENTVGAEYDAWTEEEILEYYWGEHIHLGYYKDEDLKRGAGTLFGHRVKDFIEAKEDFVDEMYAWSKVEANNGGAKPRKILDVGCGIGGATRRLASKCAGATAEVTGITLSTKQAARATALAAAQNIPNAKFEVMDALAMEFDDDTFDMVWACESGEHMPDKKKYVEEMVRVLKPGGTLVIATWCQRHTPPALTKEEKSKLQFLYDEWAHPYFISIQDYCELAEGTDAMKNVDGDTITRCCVRSRINHSSFFDFFDFFSVLSSRSRLDDFMTKDEADAFERLSSSFFAFAFALSDAVMASTSSSFAFDDFERAGLSSSFGATKAACRFFWFSVDVVFCFCNLS
jgi:MPBQ/MSBQ methyltransferase